MLKRRHFLNLAAVALPSAVPGSALAQTLAAIPAPAPQGPISAERYKTVQTVTQTGWKNDANRAFGNGPMDLPSREIVNYVSSFSAQDMSPALLDTIDTTVIDSVAALVAGYGAEPAHIAARMAHTMRSSDMPCTTFGYGFTTTPEMATFTNSCTLRYAEFNDNPHNSDMICASFAMGEALHSSGLEVMQSIAISYEVATAMGRASNVDGGGEWDGPFNCPAVAMAAGKLLKLNRDQLANALSLALVPHLPMFVTHVGALSMWKGCHAAEAARCGVFAALLAKAGMTGPAQPFDERQGWFDVNGPFRDFRIPASDKGKPAIQILHEGGGGFKRSPAEGNTQAILEAIPDFRKFCAPQEIASIRVEIPFRAWQEIADPPKWDPRNHETADHSLAYILARAILDGKIYLDSFDKEKVMDPKARRIMNVTTVWPNMTFQGHQYRMTMRSNDARQMERHIGSAASQGGTDYQDTPMAHKDILSKFRDVCAFKGVPNEKREEILASFNDLRTVSDFSRSVAALSTFGFP